MTVYVVVWSSWVAVADRRHHRRVNTPHLVVVEIPAGEADDLLSYFRPPPEPAESAAKVTGPDGEAAPVSQPRRAATAR